MSVASTPPQLKRATNSSTFSALLLTYGVVTPRGDGQYGAGTAPRPYFSFVAREKRHMLGCEDAHRVCKRQGAAASTVGVWRLPLPRA